MPIAAGEVRVGANGTVYVAPGGTAVPADVNAALNAAFVDVGYVSEEGVTTSRSLTTEQVRAWQSISTIRYLITEVGYTLSWQMMQYNKTTLPFWLGGGSIVAQGGGLFKYVVSSAPTIDERAVVIEWTDGATIKNRIVIARGMVTEGGDATIGRGAAVQLPITFAAMTPSSGTDLVTYLTNDAAFA